MKKIFKRILMALLIIFIAIQFIRPAKNRSEGISANDISTKYPVPDSVQAILKVACYDCHSNNTRYPWYAEIQPVAWWLNNHIKDGKRGLNFSEFTSYRIKKQFHRLDDINKLVKKNEMPLSSYTLIHTDAKLTEGQKLAIAAWATSIRDSIKAHYPPDSLVKK
jgi:Haem-binding domain